MAPFQSNGSLTTDKQTINDAGGWDSQAEWEAYQSASGVEIVDGSVQLAERTAFVVDDFEDGDITEYSFDSQGASSFYQIQQARTYQGTYALENTGATDNQLLYSMPGDGLGDYPQAGGLDFQYAAFIAGSDEAWFRWCLQAGAYEGDGYSIALNRGQGLEVGIWDNGYSDIQDTSLPSSATGQWWSFEVEHTSGGSITVTATDESGVSTSVTVTDTTFTSGGIGWRYQGAGNEDAVFWDGGL